MLAAAEKLGSYPSSFSMGPIIEPIADAAAVPEPEMAPKSMFAITFVWASAPGARPVMSFARLIRRTAIPPLFIILPARIKKGMANRLNTEIPEKILCAPVRTATFVSMIGSMAHTEEMPSATAIGTPASSMMTSRTNMINPETNAVFIIETPFPQIILSLPDAPAHSLYTNPQYLIWNTAQ